MEYVRQLFSKGEIIEGEEDDIAIAIIGVSTNGAITAILLTVGKPWAEQGAEKGQKVVLRPMKMGETIAYWVPTWSYGAFMLTPKKTIGF